MTGTKPLAMSVLTMRAVARLLGDESLRTDVRSWLEALGAPLRRSLESFNSPTTIGEDELQPFLPRLRELAKAHVKRPKRSGA